MFITKVYDEPIQPLPLRKVEISCTLDDTDILVVEYELGTIDICMKDRAGVYVSLDKERTDALIEALQQLRERFV